MIFEENNKRSAVKLSKLVVILASHQTQKRGNCSGACISHLLDRYFTTINKSFATVLIKAVSSQLQYFSQLERLPLTTPQTPARGKMSCGAITATIRHSGFRARYTDLIRHHFCGFRKKAKISSLNSTFSKYYRKSGKVPAKVFLQEKSQQKCL